MDYGKVVDEIFRQIEGVRFNIRLWDDREFKYGKNGKPSFILVFEDEWTAKRLLSQGALGFGESYMEGRLRIEGDLEAYLQLRHKFKKIKPSAKMAIAAFLANRSMPKSTEEQIAYHYDLGNDFFGMLLDRKTMSYSAGIYKTGHESLGEAQQRKIERICNWLDLPANSEILDLGSGWGGFAKHAAKEHKWNVTGYTLSKAQLKYCRNMADQQNLNHKVSFKYKDMLDDLPAAKYDAVVMLESIEHVGKERLANYFKLLHESVKSGGFLYVQATGQYKPRSVDKWILKYVFPGGHLPSIGELVGLAGQAGFTIEELHDDTVDYLQTMTTWISNLESHRSEIEEKFGESFYRLWELWMNGAKVSFEVNYMSLFRIVFRKPE